MRFATIRVCTFLLLSSLTNAKCTERDVHSAFSAIICSGGRRLVDCLTLKEQHGARKVYDMVYLVKCATAAECEAAQVNDVQYHVKNGCPGGEESVTQEFELRRRLEMQRRADITTDVAAASTDFTSAQAAATTSTVLSTSTSTSSKASGEVSSAEPTTSATAVSSIVESTISSPASTTSLSSSSSDNTASSTSSVMTSASNTNTCMSTSAVPVTYTVLDASSTSIYTTSTPQSACKSGYICATATQGAVTCMVRQDSLTTSGLVVTIAFGVALALSVGSLFYMCIAARKAATVMQLQREAASARDSKGGKERGRGVSAFTSSEVRLPLMSQAGPAGDEGEHGYGAAIYEDVSSVPPVPRLFS